ncbi:Serine phosphatase RsbU, regulator of sigma subunit [Streptomyces sp. yr375]|uniref:SpoIIE family protein phosphatase n=1 Tax=Streptomyces sp. yr375 TaxID=1761906 RepID=UPI0008D353EC|nr:SpoIIE family protein phosphatase [Streptomyces sp. yr375]SEP74141.1 Serine phosphatase RsbU, regulator of sigma subunit [Streptomyces sp. yr375]
MVSEGAAERRTGPLCVENALEAIAADPDSPERVRRTLEQALVFAGAALAALYTPGADGEPLRLVESAGVPRTLYGLRDSYPLDGDSPPAAAHRTGRPIWLDPAGLTDRTESPHTPPRNAHLAALPLPNTPGGTLLALTEHPNGFTPDNRTCLTLITKALAPPAGAVPAPAGPTSAVPAQALPAPAAPTPHIPAPHTPTPLTTTGDLRPSDFKLVLDTGRVEVGDGVLELFGLGRGEFDGRVETLLGVAVPEDLPSLMSVVDAGDQVSGERELEFRVFRGAGPPRWLRLRGRLRPGGDGRAARLVGTVADVSTLRDEVTDVARVQRLAAALATTGTVRDVGQAVVAALRGPLRADRIALAELENERLVVTVLDPPDPESWPALWRQEWRSEWPDAPMRTMPTLAAALREGRARIWPAGAALEPGLAEVGPGGLAVLPLSAGGSTAGACLIGWDAPHDFGPDERALLTASAGLAGEALTRARAFDAEHELVGMLQRQLLPRRLPPLAGGTAVARYLPATAGLELGGDWYDVIPLSDHHVGLVIGDVQGHSAGAATLMGQMRTALRAYATEGHPPDVVVSHANRLLLELETDLFVTCCYVDVDMEEGTAWCVRAGHPPPVLRHPDGSTVIAETDGGPPLGVVPRAEFPMTPLRLPPGTVIALTTDGLVESAELDIDTGLARLAHGLSGADPAHLGLVADALLAGAHRGDDVALLLMRYDGMAVTPLREGWTVWRVPEASRHARRFTRRTLRAWGVPDTAMDAALLVVSELVTNALTHTDGRVRLDLTLIERRLRVVVTDASPRSPVKPAAVGWQSTGGRGILLVEAVSAAWGTVPVSGGKQVWGELLLPTQSAH